MDADSAGRRGDRARRPGSRPAVFLIVGALWGALALASWIWGHDLYPRVAYTVLTVAWLGLGLRTLRKRRRRTRHVRKAL